MAISDRTYDKLQFARAILDDLKERPGNRADAFQRARQEAFLFHLHGARDAFLHEINERYQCGLQPDEVRVWKLEKCFTSRGEDVCPALKEIVRLEKKTTHTLYRLKEWRDASTHRRAVPINLYIGGELDGEHDFYDPATRKPTGRPVTDDFESMLAEVTALIDGWRTSLA